MFEKKKRGYGLSLLQKDKKKNAELFQSKSTDFKIYFKSFFFSLLNILVMYLYLKLYQI